MASSFCIYHFTLWAKLDKVFVKHTGVVIDEKRLNTFVKCTKICSCFKIGMAWWENKEQWSNRDIFFLVWINEIWKQTLHLNSTSSFPSGGDTCLIISQQHTIQTYGAFIAPLLCQRTCKWWFHCCVYACYFFPPLLLPARESGL